MCVCLCWLRKNTSPLTSVFTIKMQIWKHSKKLVSAFKISLVLTICLVWCCEFPGRFWRSTMCFKLFVWTLFYKPLNNPYMICECVLVKAWWMHKEDLFILFLQVYGRCSIECPPPLFFFFCRKLCSHGRHFWDRFPDWVCFICNSQRP